MVHPAFFVYYFKKQKKYKSMPILKSNSTLFWFWNFFPRMKNKNFTERRQRDIFLLNLFLYERSIVGLIDFITILLTPGIFLIQIVNTNNTNVHLIHFHSKINIQMHFPKSWVFKDSNQSINHYPSRCGEIKCVDISRLHNNVSPSDLKKRNNNYYIYC